MVWWLRSNEHGELVDPLEIAQGPIAASALTAVQRFRFVH